MSGLSSGQSSGSAAPAVERRRAGGRTEGMWWTIRQGDWTQELAERFGLPNWQKVWNDDNNRQLRERRIHPNVLMPGDRIFIPPIEPKQESGETEKRHSFVKPSPIAMLRIVLEDAEGKALKGVKFVMQVHDRLITGTTNGEGKIEQEIPFSAEYVKMRFQGPGGEEIRFLQYANVATALASDYNTIRAFFKSPQDPDYKAKLRLQAKKLVSGVDTILQEEAGGGSKGKGLLSFVAQNAGPILDKVAAAEGVVGKKLDELVEAAQKEAGKLAEQAQGEAGKASSMAEAMAAQTQKMGDEASKMAMGAISKVATRAQQSADDLEQQVKAKMQQMIALEKKAKDKAVELGQDAGAAIDAAAQQAKQKAQSTQQKVQSAIGEAREKYADAIQKGTELAQGKVDEAAKAAQDYFTEMVDRNVARAKDWVQYQLSQAQQRLNEGVSQAAAGVESAVDQAEEKVGEGVEAAKGKAGELLGEFSRLAHEGVADLAERAKKMAHDMGLPLDGVIDGLIDEAGTYIADAEEKARGALEQAGQQVKDKASAMGDQAKQQITQVKEDAMAAVDHEVDKAYAQIDALSAEAKEQAGEAKKQLEDAAGEVKDRLEEASQAAQQKGQQAAEQASQAAQQGAAKVQEGIGQAQQQAQEFKAAAVEAVNEGIEKISEIRRELATLAGQASEAATAQIDQAKQQAEAAVGGAQQAVQGAMGQLSGASNQLKGMFQGGGGGQTGSESAENRSRGADFDITRDEDLQEAGHDPQDLIEVLPLRVGHLDPANEVQGVIGRLNNLGYDAGPPPAYLGTVTRAAIRRFQHAEGLATTGEIDGATIGKLVEKHGC